MRKPLVAVCVLLLIAAAVAVAWFLQPGDAPDVKTASTDLPDVARGNHQPLENRNEKESDDKAPPSAPATEPEPKPDVQPAEQAPENPATTSVIGRVLDALTGEPVGDATASVRYSKDGRTVRLNADTDAEGCFRIELPELRQVPPEASITAWSGRHDTHEDQPVIDGENVIRLLPTTHVIVRIDDTSCIADAAWIRWEDGENPEHYGERFDETGTACIMIDDFTEARDARIYANRLGAMLESEALRIEPNRRHEVTLNPADGSILAVKVIGPDGRAVQNAVVEIRDRNWQITTAVTGVNGEVVIQDVPPGQRLKVGLDAVGDVSFCVAAQDVTFGGAGERTDVLFDLTGTGIVDCDFTLNGKRLTSISITGLDEESDTNGEHVWWRGEGVKRIYGLKPGRYVVEVYERQADREFSAEFEVQAPPMISKWQKEFRTYTLTVRVLGAPSTEALTLYYFTDHAREPGSATPDEAGNFVLTDLGQGEIRVHVQGAGYASRLVTVDPAQVSEIDITVERSGRLKLTPRGERGDFLTIAGPGDDGELFRLDLGKTKTTTIELPPGVYTVSAPWWDGAPWKPIEMTVVAGEEAVCEYGARYTSTLRVKVRDRSSLWDYEVKLRQDGRDVLYEMNQTWLGEGEEYYELMFEAEGTIRLVVTGSTIENFEKEFDIPRGETVSLEIELTSRK